MIMAFFQVSSFTALRTSVSSTLARACCLTRRTLLSLSVSLLPRLWRRYPVLHLTHSTLSVDVWWCRCVDFLFRSKFHHLIAWFELFSMIIWLIDWLIKVNCYWYLDQLIDWLMDFFYCSEEMCKCSEAWYKCGVFLCVFFAVWSQGRWHYVQGHDGRMGQDCQAGGTGRLLQGRLLQHPPRHWRRLGAGLLRRIEGSHVRRERKRRLWRRIRRPLGENSRQWCGGGGFLWLESGSNGTCKKNKSTTLHHRWTKKISSPTLHYPVSTHFSLKFLISSLSSLRVCSYF